MTTIAMEFPKSLTEEFRPTRIEDFVGLEKPKKILAKLAANPRECALLFIGAPGTGKTSMAQAFATAIGGELHHIPAQECKLDSLQELSRMCSYVPLTGGWHICLVDEGDCMSDAAQKYLLSRLDSAAPLPKTIWIFTANAVDRLEERFLSRCLKLDFGSYGSGGEIAALLERIWKAKAPADAERPAFKRLACSNVRESLQRLETELLAV
jgi:replication-associated recombination protein RarA